jgi:glyoxylate reductase
MSRDELLAAAQDCTAIINQAEVRVDDALLDMLPNLKVVANVAIGTDNMDLQAMARRGVWATNAPGYFGQPVAEYVLTGMLVLSRRIMEMDAFVRRGEWSAFEPGRWDGHGLFGRTLGVVGYGRIGRTLATYAGTLGMTVIPYDQGHGTENLHRLLSESDYISVHVPLNPETRNLIDTVAFEEMKPGAILANASRGGVVNQAAMIAALQSGKLGGAVLDVFADEPAVPQVLRDMQNVLLSPHAAGGTHESREAARLCAFRNVAAVLKGEAPPNAVNQPEKG